MSANSNLQVEHSSQDNPEDTAAALGSRRHTFMRVLKAAALYFALVFGTGFVLGPIRVLWAVPRFGTRAAELMEAPLMLIAMVMAARWTIQRYDLQRASLIKLSIGLMALALLLVAEFTVVLWLRGMSISEYLAGRDPVAGTVYVLLLGLFALMPWLVTRRS